jgi:Cu(I)/Ag(I) efflux system membrane fusion protein
MRCARIFFPCLLWAASGVLIAACGTPEASAQSGKSVPAKAYSTCPMHPQIIRDHPGVCPICNMDLVPVEEGAHAGTGDVSERPVVRVDPKVAHAIGVRTETARRRMLSAVLRLDARVVPEESRVYSVTTRVMGYAERIYANVSGQRVRQNEIMVELYSPDVLVTQERLLQASGRGQDEPSQLIRQRLLNWDIPASMVQRIESTGKVERLFPLSAPASGVVLRKNVLEGQMVEAGAELYQIADLSTVWVTARVYQADLAWVRVGSKASIRLGNLPGKVFASTVFFVSPEMDPGTRTAEIRMRLANTRALDLRPEMFAEVTLQDASTEPVVAVPAQALIRAGSRDVAVVALGEGRFQPREVTVGREAGGWVEILEGLKEGDAIVTSAQFLIDSESNLRAAIAQLRGGDAEDDLAP